MKKYFLLLLMIPALVFGGCHMNALEMNNLDFVIGIAFDQPEKAKMNMTVLVLDNSDMGYQTMQAEGDTLAEMDEKCVLKGKQELSYGHNQVVLISEEVARKGFYTVASSLNQSIDKRGSEQMMIVKGQAADGLGINKTTSQYPADALENMVENSSSADFVVQCKFYEFMEQMETTAATALIPYGEIIQDEEGNTGMKITGLAVIRQYTLVGILTQEEAKGAKWIREGAGADTLSITLPDGEKLGVSLSKTVATLSGEPENIHIGIQSGFVIEEQSGTRDFSLKENMEYAASAIDGKMAEYAGAACAAAKRMKADFLQLEKQFLSALPQLEGETEGWSEIVANANFSVEVQVQNQHLGMAIRPILGG